MPAKSKPRPAEGAQQEEMPGAGEQPDREILGDSATHAKAAQEHPGGSNSDPDPRPTRTGATDGGHVSAPAATQPASDHPAAGDGNDAPPGGGAISTLYALGLGDHIFPIAPGSKKPAKEGWQTSPPMSEAEARAWLDRSGNIGLRTGVKSGVVVIDDDQPKHGGGPYTPPQTGLVAASPTGSRHYYYRAPHPCLRNSESKLAEHVDVRGDGGYVVAPGSRHPGGGRYEWVATGEPADLPPEVIAKLPVRRRSRESRGATLPAAVARGSRRAQAALKNEHAALAQTPEGARNSTLNQSAFSLGQLVATGELDIVDVESALTDAATTAGLDEAETSRTLRSGLEAGMQYPRQDPPRVGKPHACANATPGEPGVAERDRVDVYAPGAHYTPPKGVCLEQSEANFVRQVLNALPEGALYLSRDAVGEVRDGEFREAEEHRIRGLLSDSVRVICGKKTKNSEADSPEFVIVTRTISRDLGSLVLANAPAIRTPLRELAAVVTAPTLRGDGTVFDAAGYDAASRTLYAPSRDYPDVPTNPTDADARNAAELLLALFVEFPFEADIDRAALLACMLTLVARPAIKGNAPGVFVGAPVWRIGKGLLVESVTMAMTGRLPLPGAAPGGRSDDRAAEWEKRIVAKLRTAPRVVLIDNLRDGSHLQSDALAAMLTAPGGEFESRDLGTSRTLRVVNRALWAFTGCNVSVEGDLAGRLLSIHMAIDDEHPEGRKFKIPDLRAHVREMHPALVTAALTILRRFSMVGRPQHGGAPLGGFEAWDACVRSAVIWVTTLCGWRSDPCDTLARLQRAAADRDGLGALLAAWDAAIGERPVTVRELLAMASSGADLRDALIGMGWKHEDPQHVGHGLRRHVDRIRGGLVLRRGDDHQKVATWRVVRGESPMVPPGSPSKPPAPETALASLPGAVLGQGGGLRGTSGRISVKEEGDGEEQVDTHALSAVGLADTLPPTPPSPPSPPPAGRLSVPAGAPSADQDGIDADAEEGEWTA